MGVHKKIPTPELMMEHFNSYKNEIKDNPILVHDFVGKDAEEVQRKRERPLTMEGFENWLFTNGIISDISDYFENKDERYSDFIPICRAIKRIIRQDQIEGGMAGVYNPSITQRLNALVEKSEVKNTGTTVVITEQPINAQNEPIKD